MKPAIDLPAGADVATIRVGLGLSQAQFAALLGISRRTLEGWEATTNRREPEGAAQMLLLVAKYRPKAITESLEQAEVDAEQRRCKKAIL